MNAADGDTGSSPAKARGKASSEQTAGRLASRLKAFAAALDAAGWRYLAGRGVDEDERYRLRVEECPEHGPLCARVTFGMLNEHLAWMRADPAAVAAKLLATMLPPAEEG
jgi:hypothetical protein